MSKFFQHHLNAKTWQAFSADTPKELATELFVEKYGFHPKKHIKYSFIMLVGPTSEVDEDGRQSSEVERQDGGVSEG